jgi:peptidoglycan/xylan/chitin deacetylase (PgdA/CDA1 family)
MTKKLNLDPIISAIVNNDEKIIERIISLSNIRLNTNGGIKTKLNVKFEDNPLNELFLKRRETTVIAITSKFVFQSLPGEILATLENGFPALSYYKENFFFNFDLFYTIRYYLSEKDVKIQNGFINYQIIKLYWKTPKPLRNRIRKRVRKQHSEIIHPPNHFLAIISNVLVKVLEMCLKKHDTAKGYSQGIQYLREIERDLQVSATGFMIPFGHEYKPKVKEIRDLANEDFEIALHGYSHDGLLLRQGREPFERKISKALSFFKNAEIDIFGFRSPWVWRNEFLLESLCRLGFQYDSSYPDKDTLALTHPLRGLLYNRPITRNIYTGDQLTREIIQIPISYPQDVQILEDYHLSDEEAFNYLKTKIDFIKDFEGIFVFHTHPIHLLKRGEFFKKVIKYSLSLGFSPLLMKEIADKFQNQNPFMDPNT